MQARLFWSLWQELLLPFAACFTIPGWKRFVEWVTGLALNVEEHTITQSVLALTRPDDWKALETFAETGAWETDKVEDTLTRLLETAPGRLWHGYRVDAVDATKVHRRSKDVWGTCIFHEYTARCPNRAGTVGSVRRADPGPLRGHPDAPGEPLRADLRRVRRVLYPVVSPELWSRTGRASSSERGIVRANLDGL